MKNALASLGVTPFNGYGDMSQQPMQQPQAAPAPKRGGMGNALSAFGSAFFEGLDPQGQAQARDKRQTAEMAEMLKSGNYGGAAGVAYDRGDVQQGMSLAQYGEQKTAAQQQQVSEEQKQALGTTYSFMQNMMSLPDEQRAQFLTQNWQMMAPIAGGMDAQSFLAAQGGDLSDASLADDMAQLRTLLGEGPAVKEEYTLAPGARRFIGDQELAANPKDTSMTEYQAAQLGLSRDRLEFDKSKPSTPLVSITNTNGPDQPFGGDKNLPIGGGTKGKEEAVVRGFNGEPIVVPGSKAQLYNKTKNSIESYSFQNNLVIEDIGRARALSDSAFTTGFTGSIAKAVPGTPAYDLSKVLDGIKANVGFDKLQDMRDNSPTGGALGQVSEWELVLLQSVLGSLEQAQTKEQFNYNLERLEEVKTMGDAKRREAFAQDFPALRDYKEFAFDAGQQIKAAPQGAIEMLRGDPSLKEAFDQKYGAGAADKALGGQ